MKKEKNSSSLGVLALNSGPREFMNWGLSWKEMEELTLTADGIEGPWPKRWKAVSIVPMCFGCCFILEKIPNKYLLKIKNILRVLRALRG